MNYDTGGTLILIWVTAFSLQTISMNLKDCTVGANSEDGKYDTTLVLLKYFLVERNH